MRQLTNGTFKVNPISRTIVGKELVVVQTRNTMVLGDEEIETDVVVVFRIVDGLISEIWDIPSVYS
jgi:predicted SnoaL-like aldol condensation-catalyzing enzyme